MENKKWNRNLGTSKKDQGVITPKQPQHKKRRIKNNLTTPTRS